MEVQVVDQAVFVMITTFDCDVCSFSKADDNDVVPGLLTAGIKLVMLVIAGTVLLTMSSATKEVGKMVSKGLVEIEEAEQLVSVTVVLSVTVTTDTGNDLFWMEVELIENEVSWILLETVEWARLPQKHQ